MEKYVNKEGEVNNLKGLLNLWAMDIHILLKDINLFRLRFLASYRAFKLDNLNDKLTQIREEKQ